MITQKKLKDSYVKFGGRRCSNKKAFYGQRCGAYVFIYIDKHIFPILKVTLPAQNLDTVLDISVILSALTVTTKHF